MGYEAICDFCEKRLPKGEFLRTFVIGSVPYDSIAAINSERWGEVCEDCFKTLKNDLTARANQRKEVMHNAKRH